MTRSNYEVLIPALLVGVILPVAAGRWFRYEYPDAIQYSRHSETAQAGPMVLDTPVELQIVSQPKVRTISSRVQPHLKTRVPEPAQAVPAAAIEEALNQIPYD